ncbi:MipA/OmpV family protein [Sphingomonas sp.]|uniref:MipA/OmpV family protein n=1 Tax=Sphingomonas sp. TaxID=28214 RepID=UPI002E332FAB|nr:MipA/OmpV family protein [Sphingomonas sp.]HEX4695104.1 MipA/OmpV family protein [Sphingomonas sp.]
MRLVFSLTALAAALAAAPAFAQDAPATPPAAAPVDTGGDSITIGAGGAYIPDYEGSDHYVLRPVPGAIGSVSGFNFTLAGNRASIDLIPNKPGPTWDFQAGPIGVVNFNRSSLKSIDDPRVRALGKRSTSIEVGGFVGIGKTGVITSEYDRLSFSVSYVKGVTGAMRSGIFSPTVNYFTPLSHKAAVGLYVSAERAERGYGRAYFDVDPAGSLASGLPVYYTRGGWKDWTAGAIGTVSLTGDLLHGFKLVAGGTYTRLLNDFGRSPIVSIAGNRSQWQGVVGLAYTF